jgi:DNA-binding CsgD family transcriptional regulator
MDRYLSKRETIDEAEFLLSMRVSHWQVADQLGLQLKTLETYWRKVKGVRAPWLPSMEK